MAAGVTAQLALKIAASLTGSGDLGSPKLKIDDISEVIELTPGTDAISKANLMFADSRTLAGSANESLDLVGSLTDAFGATISAAELVLVFIKAHDVQAGLLNITRPASNGAPLFMAAGDGISLKPNEFFLFASPDGIALTAGTADLVNIANTSASPATYDILLIARSVAA